MGSRHISGPLSHADESALILNAVKELLKSGAVVVSSDEQPVCPHDDFRTAAPVFFDAVRKQCNLHVHRTSFADKKTAAKRILDVLIRQDSLKWSIKQHTPPKSECPTSTELRCSKQRDPSAARFTSSYERMPLSSKSNPFVTERIRWCHRSGTF